MIFRRRIRNRRFAARHWAAGVLALGLLAGTGCVERTLVITSEPPGAHVVVNNRWEGNTPLTVPFRDYGVFLVEMDHPDYFPLRVSEPLTAPLYDVAGLDFLSNVLYPGRISDVRNLHYRLERTEGAVDRIEDVAERASAMRAERDRRLADRAAKDAARRFRAPDLPLTEKHPEIAAARRADRRRPPSAAPGPQGLQGPQYTPPVPGDIPVDALIAVSSGADAAAPGADAGPASGDSRPAGYTPPVPVDVPVLEAAAPEVNLRYGEVPETPAPMGEAAAAVPQPAPETPRAAEDMVMAPVIAAPSVVAAPVAVRAIEPLVDLSTPTPTDSARPAPAPGGPGEVVDANPPSAEALEADWIDQIVLK